MKLTVLVDNYVNSQKLKAEHGLSILIEEGGRKILFDCGESDLVLANLKVLGIDLNSIDSIVLSHGHYDHTGGLLPVLKHMDKRVDIYAHPAVFGAKYSRYGNFNSANDKRYIGIPEKKEVYEKKGAKFILNKDLSKIGGNIYFSGQIPRESKIENPEGFLIKEYNNFVVDTLDDDISIFADLDKTLLIITGCAHSGILNILNKCKKLKPDANNVAIIGGLHLNGKDCPYIDYISGELKKNNVRMIIPMHCTGPDAFARLKKNFGNDCIMGSVGKVVEFK